jgi:hypothetical protein
VSILRKRLQSVEDRIELRKHRDFLRELESRSVDEQSFLCIHGYWPENATELPQRVEFTVRGIQTIVTTQWADEDQKK